MNRAEAAAMLPVITAFAKGEDIQCLGSGREWCDIDEPNFINGCDYRIKPKAEEFFAVYDKDGQRLATCAKYSDAYAVQVKNTDSTIRKYVEAGKA